MATTLFTWGYFGWGNATEQLVRAVDAVERDRGFRAPVFVDIRIRRNVRAAGFNGTAFEELLGPRHVWMRGLGNEAIRTGEGGIRISEPGQAGDLLDLALQDEGRRVIFFCSCQWPKFDGRVACHRHTVAGLVLKAARRRGEDVEVVEWPGGEPSGVVRGADAETLAALRRGRSSVPLGDRLPPAELRGLPWGSPVRVGPEGEGVTVIGGPARFRSGAWELPVLEALEGSVTDESASRRSAALRRAFGLEVRRGV